MVWDNKPVCPYCHFYHRDYRHPADKEDAQQTELECVNCKRVFDSICYVRFDYKTLRLEGEPSAH